MPMKLLIKLCEQNGEHVLLNLLLYEVSIRFKGLTYDNKNSVFYPQNFSYVLPAISITSRRYSYNKSQRDVLFLKFI